MKYSYILLLAALFVACNKQQPQLPANKGNSVENDLRGMVVVNEKLALREDSILREYANELPGLTRSELGFWYKIDKSTSAGVIKLKDKCVYRLSIFLLSGQTVIDKQESIEIGKKQTLVGVEEGLKLMRRGESATLLLPSHLAYGMRGYQNLVAAYTPIVCKIELQY